MIPVPIFPPVTIEGRKGRWLVLGPAQDRVGGNVWVVPVKGDHDGGWVANHERGQSAVRVTSCRPWKGRRR